MGCRDRLVVPTFTNDEIADAVKRGGLLTMEIEFNGNCNLRCVYCYAKDSAPSDGDLSPGEFEDVITQARGLGARTIVVLGGEPMLYPHLIRMLRFMRGLGIGVELFTNGVNMSLEAARELFGLGVTVVLKMNSFNEPLQDMLAGVKGAHRQIQSALSNLREAGYPSERAALGLSTIICNHNYGELDGLWMWLRQEGITPYFEMITPQGRARGRENLYVDPLRSRDLFYRLAAIDREFGYEWEPQPPLVGMECLRHQYSCVVNPQGLVYPCVGVNIAVGSIRDKKLAEIIGASEVISRLRNFREHLTGPCRECEQAAGCYGCRGAAYQLTGDYMASDPLCWKNSGAEAGREGHALPMGAEALVPHKPPMLIVERLLEVRDSSAASLGVPEGMVFAGSDGVVDEVAYVEMIAQTMAAHNGFQNLGKDSAKEGFIAGVKGFKVFSEARVGDSLRVEVSKVAEFGGELAIIRGAVFKGGLRLAEGEIKVFHRNGNGNGKDPA